MFNLNDLLLKLFSIILLMDWIRNLFMNLLSINKYFYSLRCKLIFTYQVDEDISRQNIIIILQI